MIHTCCKIGALVHVYQGMSIVVNDGTKAMAWLPLVIQVRVLSVRSPHFEWLPIYNPLEALCPMFRVGYVCERE